MWGLALPNILWKFLELDVLFVSEMAEIVDDFKAALASAGWALGGFLHFSIVQGNCGLSAAVAAAEKGHLHVGVHLRCADYYSAH